MSTDTRDVYLRLDGSEPIFPDHCVVCGMNCGDDREVLTASAAENRFGPLRLFGRRFKVPMHHLSCAKKQQALWFFWQRGFFLGCTLGFLMAIPVAAVTDNMYIVMGIGLGIPMASAIVAFVCRDFAPFQLYEIRDGMLHKFVFRTESSAHEFGRLNTRTLASEE